MPCICLEVSYKKTIPSPLPKFTQCLALAERSYSGASKAQDGQLLCGWILGIGEVGRHQGIRLQEVAFPIEEPGETPLRLAEAGRYGSKGREAAPSGSTSCHFLCASLLASERCKCSSPGLHPSSSLFLSSSFQVPALCPLENLV